MRIICQTSFDITATGVRNNFSRSRMPFVDDTGRTIADLDSWQYARNQQRNWETVNQIISLRALPINIETPQRKNNQWTFSFEIDQPATIEKDSDPVGYLVADAESVPMIVGLGEKAGLAPMLRPGSNITFKVAPNK